MHDAEKGIYVASLPEGATAQTRDLFVNGKRATVSRTDPNDRFIDSKFTKETITTKVPSLANLERPQDVNIVLRNMWSESRTMVESAVTEGDTTTLYMVQPGWTNYNVTAPAGGDRISSAHFSAISWYCDTLNASVASATSTMWCGTPSISAAVGFAVPTSIPR